MADPTAAQQQTSRLVELGEEHLVLHAHPVTGSPYAKVADGPGIRRPFKGDGSIRPALARLFMQAEGHVPGQGALNTALSLLSEKARENGPDLAEEIVAGAAPQLFEGDGARPSAATQLVEFAQDGYTLGVTPDGEAFAVPQAGPQIVRQLRGGRQSLRAELAAIFFEKTGTAAAQAALADACSVLEGQAQRLEPTELHLRVADLGDRLVLDLGDPTGRAVVISPRGWQVVDEPPAAFRRTALTAALPTPIRAGSLDEALWPLLNVRPSHRPVLAAVLVASLIPRIPHPITALTGEQGVGKTSATKIISSVLDPSTVQVRKAPRDQDAWVTAAAGSWWVSLDNLSEINDTLSDGLCRASTGDGDVRRRLYSDGDLHVVQFRRCVLLNGIDLGAVKDDLSDRLVTVALDRISDRQRREDAEIIDTWQANHPAVLGALLDLAVKVLQVLPTIKLPEAPRMIDFARVLAAVDQVLGTDGLNVYLGARTEMAEDAVNSDPTLVAIVRAVGEEWIGTAAQLLPMLPPDEEKWRAPKGWPANARALTTILRRRAPSLRRLGWTAELTGEKDSVSRAVLWRLTPPPTRRSGANDARNARNARGDLEPAGQDGDEPSSETRATSSESSETRATSDRSRSNEPFHSTFARTEKAALTRGNTTQSSVSSETSDNRSPSHTPAGRCTLCGLAEPGPRDPNGRCLQCTPTAHRESA